jgi:hypothetical protein
MKKQLWTSLPLASIIAALSAPVAAVEECYESVCSTIEVTNSCVTSGENTQLNVQGDFNSSSGFAITAYQVVADAEWRYNDHHQVELVNGKVIESSGFHFGSSYKKQLEVTGGEASSYTFVFGSRAFGHGFYDVAVDLPMGSGGASQPLQIDIKPGSCPNPINMNKKGVTPVAIVGDGKLDLRSINPADIRLAGVAPVKFSYEDVASAIPQPATSYDCTTSLADGQEDLSLMFLTQDLVAAIKENKEVLGREPFDGEQVELVLTINSGDPAAACDSGYIGKDRIQALVKGKK